MLPVDPKGAREDGVGGTFEGAVCRPEGSHLRVAGDGIDRRSNAATEPPDDLWSSAKHPSSQASSEEGFRAKLSAIQDRPRNSRDRGRTIRQLCG